MGLISLEISVVVVIGGGFGFDGRTVATPLSSLSGVGAGSSGFGRVVVGTIGFGF